VVELRGEREERELAAGAPDRYGRTVAYALVIAILGAAYVGLVVGSQRVTRPLTGGGDHAGRGRLLAWSADSPRV
jgi:predicted membrane protein